MRLCGNLPLQVSELKQAEQLYQPLKGNRSHSHVRSFLSKSAPVKQWSVESPTRWKFLQSPIANITPTPRDTPVTDDSPVRPHSSHTLPGPTAGKRVHPRAGQVGRWKVETGIQSEVSSCTVQHSSAPPLHYTPLPWEKLTGEYNIAYTIDVNTKAQQYSTVWTFGWYRRSLVILSFFSWAAV